MGAPLDHYALQYGTDKGSTAHNYCPLYERHIGHYRDRAFRLLEMGVYQGASLRMWRDYFPKARILGIDINPEYKFSEERIQVCVGSQDDPLFLRDIQRLYGPFEVVIDDAGHRWGQIIAALEIMLPLVVPGGYYVIEDLEGSYSEDHREGNETPMMRMHQMVEDLVRWGNPLVSSMCFYRDICFIERSGAA